MKHWLVKFEVYGNDKHSFKDVEVEAGTKKLAMIRAMGEINKLDGYSELFKKVLSIEEVASIA